MPRFKYVAMDAKGAESEGVIDAESQSQAVSMIRAKGLFPTRLVDLSDGAGKNPVVAAVKGKQAQAKGLHMEIKMPRLFKRKVKPKELMIFTRQFATLTEAGLPLLRGLRILLKQEKHPALREALSGMGEAVEGGSTFSEALAMYPHIFDKLFVNMVRAGEAGGVLELVLNRLAEFMEKTERVKNKIKSAMIYPIVVLVAAVGIVAFLMTTVIPKFEEIFRDLLEGKSLPPLTLFVVTCSRVVKEHGLFVVGIIAAVVVLLKMWRKTEKGRYAMDKFKLRAPIFGPLFTKTAVARFTRTLGTLLGAGVPILQALMIVRDTAGNDVIARAIQQVHDSVKEGDTMALPLEASGVFPTMVVSMVDVGEETGALPEMLIKIADNYDDEVDTAVEGLTSVIEPVMIIFLAVVVGLIVISMFMPLISIMSQLSQ